MTTYSRLLTPVGELVLTASEAALTGVYFPTSRRGGPPTHHAEWIESNGEGPSGEILARTHDNNGFLVFYALFVAAVAVHAPIGLRNVIREWTPWRGRSLDLALAGFAVVLLTLGARAVIAVYVA